MPVQLRSDAVGCFGGFAMMSSIDALAARGMRFTGAYSQNSVCSPSRVSMFTGWYPHVRGHRTLTHLLKPDEPNLLKMFRDAGYHVARAGRRGDTFSKEAEKASLDRYGYDVKPTSMFDFQPADHETPWAPFCALIFPHPPLEVEEPWFSLHDRAAIPPRHRTDLAQKPAYMKRMHDARR